MQCMPRTDECKVKSTMTADVEHPANFLLSLCANFFLVGKP
jgi:hypothetical protein